MIYPAVKMQGGNLNVYLQLLDGKYKVKAVQPVDMFPHTHHVENVVLLELR